MKMQWETPKNGEHTEYCITCNAQNTISKKQKDGRFYFHCDSCNLDSERVVILSPNAEWWIDDSNILWHRSVGVVVVNQEHKILLQKHAFFPHSYSVPSGHVEVGEDPKEAAKRELHEETGLEVTDLQQLGQENIRGDSCSIGSDDHAWHAYVTYIDTRTQEPIMSEESATSEWFTVEKALKLKNLAPPARVTLEKYKEQI